MGLVVVFAIGQAQVMWAQSGTVDRAGARPDLHPWPLVPQLSFLFWGWLPTVLVYSLCGAVAGTIFRIITELGAFVVHRWTGDMAAGVEWAGPTGIMTAWRRSLVTIPYIVAAGLATVMVSELTQMLISGRRNVGSGAPRRELQTAAVARVAVTGGCRDGDAGVRRDLWEEQMHGARHLIGAGLSGIGLPPGNLIKIMITFFLCSTKGRKAADRATLVLRPRVARSLDLNSIKRSWT